MQKQIFFDTRGIRKFGENTKTKVLQIAGEFWWKTFTKKLYTDQQVQRATYL